MTLLPSFDLLCRAYLLTSEALPSDLPFQAHIGQLVDVAWGALRNRQLAPGAVQQGLWACWQDGRLRCLHPRQRYVLIWFGSACAAGWSIDQSWALDVVARTYAAGRSVWSPAAWQPWMGSRPELRPRRSLLELEGEPPPEDPSGDPEPESAPVALEGESHQWSWFSLGQILDGLDHWGATLQQHVGLPLGDMQRTGSPEWRRFMLPHQLEPAQAGEELSPVERVFRIVA